MSRRSTVEEYIEKCQKIHGDRYDYSSLIYRNSSTKVDINCRIHGIFQQWPADHRRGFGCPSCSRKKKYTTETFIVEAKKRHGNKYLYNRVQYINLDTSIEIICLSHGIFKMTPRTHLHNDGGTGSGCPICNFSKGEREIAKSLDELKIEYISQKIFKGCKGRFDFYLPSYNLCIEFDGAQHFHFRHIRQHFNKEQKLIEFEKIQFRDRRKNLFCKKEGINLLRIDYREFNNIKNILYENLYYSS